MNETKHVVIHYKQRDFYIEYFERTGTDPIILFLHGLGGAKENFDWATKHKALVNSRLISFDNPGTGSSSYFPDCRLTHDDLTELTHLFIENIISDQFYLAGASMGGLTLINYMKKFGSEKVLGLINMEGNLMLEDCMFSSKVIAFNQDEFLKKEYSNTILEMRKNPSCGYQTIANNLELNTDPTSYYDYSFQTVEYSKNGNLYEAFVNFSCPKLFLYGDKNSHLSYLHALRQTNVLVKEISHSDHFLFYDNPRDLYKEVAEFVNR